LVGSVGVHTKLTAKSTGGTIELCHPRWADFEAWVALRRENLEYLRPWEPDISTAGLNRSAYRARLARLKRLVQQDRAYPFYMFRETTLIGACNITHIDRGTAQSARLAAVKAATQFCFEGLNLHRVEAAVQVDNAASIKVLKAAAYQFEGTARGLLKVNGAWRDHDIYARLRDD